MNMIKEQYNIVFDELGNVRNCGRNNCILLIKLLNDEFPDVDFGNEETGFMNIKNIKEKIQNI